VPPPQGLQHVPQPLGLTPRMVQVEIIAKAFALRLPITIMQSSRPHFPLSRIFRCGWRARCDFRTWHKADDRRRGGRQTAPEGQRDQPVQATTVIYIIRVVSTRQPCAVAGGSRPRLPVLRPGLAFSQGSPTLQFIGAEFHSLADAEQHFKRLWRRTQRRILTSLALQGAGTALLPERRVAGSR
jgi:hypothetical protein